jgi:hypothetical protein
MRDSSLHHSRCNMDDFVFVYFECDNFYTPYARSYAGSPRSLITSNTLPRASLSQKPSPRSPPYPTATHAPQFHLRHLQLFDTLLHRAGQADTSNEKERFASPGGSVIPGTLWAESCASTEEATRRPKIGIIKIGLLRDLSEIKLKRTDGRNQLNCSHDSLTQINIITSKSMSLTPDPIWTC